MSEETHSSFDEPPSEEKGYLVHLFIGDQNPAELAVLRKICMKYGLTSWDVMTGYLPWRNRASLRTTMCRILRKQALSEYDAIRADPLKIQKDNESLAKDLSTDYVFKGGVLVNTRWDRSNDEWADVRQRNAAKYSISEEEAQTIFVPSIVSVDFMRQQCFKRRQSLLVYRAALRAEIARRKGMPCDDLGVDELQIRSGREVVLPKPCTKLETETDESRFFFNPNE